MKLKGGQIFLGLLGLAAAGTAVAIALRDDDDEKGGSDSDPPLDDSDEAACRNIAKILSETFGTAAAPITEADIQTCIATAKQDPNYAAAKPCILAATTLGDLVDCGVVTAPDQT